MSATLSTCGNFQDLQEGYTAEKRKGNIVRLGPGETFSTAFECGLLSPARAADRVAKIERITGGRSATV